MFQLHSSAVIYRGATCLETGADNECTSSCAMPTLIFQKAQSFCLACFICSGCFSSDLLKLCVHSVVGQPISSAEALCAQYGGPAHLFCFTYAATPSSCLEASVHPVHPSLCKLSTVPGPPEGKEPQLISHVCHGCIFTVGIAGASIASMPRPFTVSTDR